MITANHPQVTNLPLQVRCSSQPMGLRSSFRSIQRRKKESQNIGVQKVLCHLSCNCDGGRSCQARLVWPPASTIASISPNSDRAVTKPMPQSNWTVEGEKKRM